MTFFVVLLFLFTENMIAALWLLTLTLITTSECIYAAPPLVEYRRSEDNRPLGVQVNDKKYTLLFSNICRTSSFSLLLRLWLFSMSRRFFELTCDVILIKKQLKLKTDFFHVMFVCGKRTAQYQ